MFKISQTRQPQQLSPLSAVRLLTAGLLISLALSCSSPLGPSADQDTDAKANAGSDILRTSGTTSPETGEPFSANVMAPLRVTDWDAFENQLSIAADMGVDAVSVDVWWGDVEAAGDQQFDWSYYDTIFQKITAAGLDIVAIMSFHQCGGNVGDDYSAPLPAWIWNHYTGQGLQPEDLKYVSETGASSAEYISLWADAHVLEEYAEFMEAFETRYAGLAADIDELNISGGTAGELRYPSYNSHDWGGYPNRGTLQAYSSPAVEDFQAAMADKYGTLSALNSAWGTSLADFSQIQPPSDPDTFFNSGDYRNTAYGRDFLGWYNQSLISHGRRLIQTAADAFDEEMAAIELGIKIPGIHWTMNDPERPRLAEMTAGLIPSGLDFQSPSTGHGYSPIVGAAAGWDRPVNLHFTCLEMGNEDSAPAYSRAQDLVFWVSEAAANAGVPIKGENALAGGAVTHEGWDNIENALEWASYSGLTVLRMEQVTWNSLGRDRCTGVIDTYGQDNPNPDGSITIHYQEFESAEGYSLHGWNGLEGDYPLTYEGQFNGTHWWSVTLEDVPENFSFCFVNSNGTWDGVNRRYTGQGEELYTPSYSSQVTTSRP